MIQVSINRWFGVFVSVLVVALCIPVAAFASSGGGDAGEYYTDEHVYSSRPNPDREMTLDCIGVTGIKARIYKGVVVKVEGTLPNSPAEGKFKKGQIITGINGKALKGKNPFVMLGNALTAAEASDGKMVFDVQDAKATSSKKIFLKIPVLGAYSPTWPLNCNKSKKIIEQAARFYSDKQKFNQAGMTGALGMLFLLSTGEDKYLPRVKEYFDRMSANVEGIGEHTWHNGYNGIACAEYYLRTGDKSVLPILTYLCKDAKERQAFGCSWAHWGRGISPGYVAGGLMNPAGSQVLTTLLLSKECGVDVDQRTLLGALRFWYHFAGHGTVPYGDHRSEGGLGSNGKDGMSAAVMQIASGAQGDTTIYRLANKYLSMSTITSYPVLVRGHGDEGRGDAIWRGIASSYMLDFKPKAYYAAMQRLEWWYDLSRRPSGALGVATCQRFDDIGSGAGVAISYTAPLKTLRITGAPRSKYAKDFKLPEKIWGREADRAFLSIENNPEYLQYGKDEPIYIPFRKFGCAYAKPAVDLKSISKNEMLKNVYHKRYMIRVQAAKALRISGAFAELEKLLQNKDPRVRRAGLDGMIDYNYWFSMGKSPIKMQDITPGMIAAIRKMLADPEEALYVVDGALMAMKLAPAEDIEQSLPLIMPWTTHADWWLRESSFLALSGLEKDDARLLKVLPTMLDMMVNEYHTMPRARMLGQLKRIMRQKQADSEIDKLIMAAHMRAVKESTIKEGIRAAEGTYNILGSIDVCLKETPETALEIAKVMKSRFNLMGTKEITKLVATPNSNRENKPYGLYSTLEKQEPRQKQLLTDMLYNDYRMELIKRKKTDENEVEGLVDTIIDLTKLKNPNAGWVALGNPNPVERIWRYTSFDPQQEKDRVHPREKKRFRNVALPSELEGWQQPDFDDSKWKSGKAPIGKGLFKRGNTSFKNNSEWGAGEFLVMRTSFELDQLEYDTYRISILASQGFDLYLNGHKIQTYVWWKDMPHYRLLPLTANNIKYLKKGTNILAAYTNTVYPNKINARKKEAELGQIDFYLEGLKNSDFE